MSNSRLDGVRKGTRIPDLLLRRQSLYPTELYGPIVLKPAISRGLTPYIVFLGLDNILSEEGIIHGLLLSIYCRVRSHFSRRIELTTELLFFSRLVLALFLRRAPTYCHSLSIWGKVNPYGTLLKTVSDSIWVILNTPSVKLCKALKVSWLFAPANNWGMPWYYHRHLLYDHHASYVRSW